MLLVAGAAPGRPEVEDDGAATEVGESERFSTAHRPERERWRGAIEEGRPNLVGVPSPVGDEDAEEGKPKPDSDAEDAEVHREVSTAAGKAGTDPTPAPSPGGAKPARSGPRGCPRP